MRVLRQVVAGPKVAGLKKLGFGPGLIDGDFELAPETTDLALQRGEGLLADGIVGVNLLRPRSMRCACQGLFSACSGPWWIEELSVFREQVLEPFDLLIKCFNHPLWGSEPLGLGSNPLIIIQLSQAEIGFRLSRKAPELLLAIVGLLVWPDAAHL